MARYVADTNVYVRAANHDADRAAFAAFAARRGPLVLSTLVLAELLLGIPEPGDRAAMLHYLTTDAPPRTPTRADWLTAARATAELGGDAVTKSRSFGNDTLLAAQCVRLGLVLVTHRTANFARLARVIPVVAVAPFPA